METTARNNENKPIFFCVEDCLNEASVDKEVTEVLLELIATRKQKSDQPETDESESDDKVLHNLFSEQADEHIDESHNNYYVLMVTSHPFPYPSKSLSGYKTKRLTGSGLD